MPRPRLAHILTVLLYATLLAVLPAHAQRRRAPAELKDMTVRARVTQMPQSEAPTRIHWRYGGEGLGGDVVSGELTAVVPPPPKPKMGGMNGEDEMTMGITLEEEPNKPTDRVIVPGDTYNYHYMNRGVWSPAVPVGSVASRGRFVTFTLERLDGIDTGPFLGGVLEVQLLFRDKPVKTISINGADGPTFGVKFPTLSFDEDGPTDESLAGFLSLYDYIQLKIDHLKAQPGIERPTPQLYAIITDCSGYKTGSGYGVRTTDPETMWAEYEVMKMMGFNSVRGAPSLILEQIAANEGLGQDFRRAYEMHTTGYPIPTIDIGDGRKPFRHPGDGCPYDPINREPIRQRAQSAAKTVWERAVEMGVDSAWGLTVDEIGSVFDKANEGKAHMGSCPYCREAFRDMIKRDGWTPEDFGAKDWEPIRATYGYWSYNYWESHKMLTEQVAAAEAAMKADANAGAAADLENLGHALKSGDDALDVGDLALDGPAPDAETPAAKLARLKSRLETLEWSGRVLEVPEDQRQLQVSDAGWRLLQYYSRRFNAESCGWLFKAVQEEFEAYNKPRREAEARGETDTPAAKRPYIYSMALRGNNFLLGGHSLGFFDFYKYADNAMVYETSNRDPRVWQWDSYLCDVGRSLHLHRDKEFGIYVKPHRGAAAQRALASVARGVRLLFWYTYGPEWKKGDTWGGRLPILAAVADTNRIIASAEDITYESHWAHQPQVAVVRPRTSEFLGNAASWENGKWVYTMLQHSHVPVEALDEDLLMDLDLARFDVIVVSGSHIQRRVATKLAAWVEAGGTLYTTAGGLARDEADLPSDIMNDVFGVTERADVDIWGSVRKYGATSLPGITQNAPVPENAAVTGSGMLQGSYTPEVGREILKPTPNAEILATYADGSPAAIRHTYGKGTAYLIGTYAGMEYAADIMDSKADKDYRADKRTWVAAPVLAAGVLPAADALSAPLVESVLLQHDHSDRQAVVVINWGVDRPDGLTLRVRTQATKARSGALSQDLTVTRVDDTWIDITVPTLLAGDIIALDP